MSNRLRIFNPLVFELGLRYDRASHTKDSDFSPRINAMIELAKGSQLRLGWGQYRQVHGIEETAALDAGGQYYPSELSEQWTAGIEHSFASGARLRLEGYYKDGSNLRPAYRNWVAGALDVFPETNEDRILVYPEKTTAKGLEVYYAQNMGRKLAIKGSHAFAFVDEQVRRIDNINAPDPIEFDPEHVDPQDQRHALNLDLTYRPARAWSVNLSYAYHSGWPITLAETVEVVRDDGETDVASRSEKLYSSRLPAYYRADARVTRKFRTARGDVRLFLEVVNLTNHENIFAYDYEKAIDSSGAYFLRREGETWFPLLPSIGISWNGGF